MLYYRLIHSRGKFTVIMTAYVVSTFKVSNSKPFQNMGFIPGMFINRFILLTIHNKHFAGPKYYVLTSELSVANL